MVRTWTVLAALGIAASICSAGPLASDPAGMTGWKGTKTYAATMSGFSVFSATVDYCVFAPGSGPLAGQHPSDYVYAYQITGVTGGMFGPGLVARLSVGLNDGDELPQAIGAYGAAAGEVAPSASAFDGVPVINTAGWDFLSAQVIDQGETSEVLFFTSPFGPEWDTSTVKGTMSAVAGQYMPSPTPEPLTLAMLAAAAPLLLRKRR